MTNKNLATQQANNLLDKIKSLADSQDLHAEAIYKIKAYLNRSGNVAQEKQALVKKLIAMMEHCDNPTQTRTILASPEVFEKIKEKVVQQRKKIEALRKEIGQNLGGELYSALLGLSEFYQALHTMLDEKKSLAELQQLFIPKAQLINLKGEVFLISKETALKLCCRDSKGSKIKENEYGQHPVIAFKGVYYKPNPKTVGLTNSSLKVSREHAVYEMGRTLTGKPDGYCFAKSTIIKIKHPESEDTDIIQASTEIKGFCLQDIVKIQEILQSFENKQEAIEIVEHVLAQDGHYEKEYKGQSLENDSQNSDEENHKARVIAIHGQFQAIAPKLGVRLASSRDLYLASFMNKSRLIRSVFGLLAQHRSLLLLASNESDLINLVSDLRVIFEILPKLLNVAKPVKEVSSRQEDSLAEKKYLEIINLFDKLDIEATSWLMLTLLIVLPTDAKLDNFQLVVDYQNDGKTIKNCRIIGIDNDDAFVYPFYVKLDNNQPSYYMTIKNMLNYIPQIRNHIIPEQVIKRLQSKTAEQWFELWLRGMQAWGQHNQKLLDANIFIGHQDIRASTEEGKQHKLDIPFVFSKHLLVFMLTKLELLQNIFRATASNKIAYIDLFRKLYPIVSEIYAHIDKRYSSLSSKQQAHYPLGMGDDMNLSEGIKSLENSKDFDLAFLIEKLKMSNIPRGKQGVELNSMIKLINFISRYKLAPKLGKHVAVYEDYFKNNSNNANEVLKTTGQIRINYARQHLNFYKMKNPLISDIHSVFEMYPGITSLDVYDINISADSFFSELGNMLTELSKLTVSQLSDLKRLSCRQSPLPNFITLESLKINDCEALSEFNIIAPNLKILRLHACAQLKEINLSQANENLVSIEISDAGSLEKLDLRACKKLEALQIRNCSNLRAITFPKDLGPKQLRICKLEDNSNLKFEESTLPENKLVALKLNQPIVETPSPTNNSLQFCSVKPKTIFFEQPALPSKKQTPLSKRRDFTWRHASSELFKPSLGSTKTKINKRFNNQGDVFKKFKKPNEWYTANVFTYLGNLGYYGSESNIFVTNPVNQHENQFRSVFQNKTETLVVPLNNSIDPYGGLGMSSGRGSHWTVLVLKLSEGSSKLKIYHIDSLARKDSLNPIFKKYLQALSWDVEISSPITKAYQLDGSNCGPWTAEFIRLLVLNKGDVEKTIKARKHIEDIVDIRAKQITAVSTFNKNLEANRNRKLVLRQALARMGSELFENDSSLRDLGEQLFLQRNSELKFQAGALSELQCSMVRSSSNWLGTIAYLLLEIAEDGQSQLSSLLANIETGRDNEQNTTYVKFFLKKGESIFIKYRKREIGYESAKAQLQKLDMIRSQSNKFFGQLAHNSVKPMTQQGPPNSDVISSTSMPSLD